MNRSLSANRGNPQTSASDDRYHRTFLLILVISFCVIGWLNVSVGLCVFCSSVFSVRKRTFLRLAGEFFLSQNSQNSKNFLRTFRVHKKVVHLLLMLIFNLRCPPLWVLFCVQMHLEELKALEGVGAGLLGNSGKFHLDGVVALFGVEALRNHC